MKRAFLPEVAVIFSKDYVSSQLKADIFAGLIVGILAIPLSIAFAIASGARPEQGLLTAIVAGGISALTTGCRHQISGPTGAFVILVSSIIAEFGYGGMVFATLMAGIMLVAFGLSRFGAAIKFIPYPVVIGFTSGIALTIFTGQIPDFFGLHFQEKIPSDVMGRWIFYATHGEGVNLVSVCLAALAVCIVGFWPRLKSSIPGSLVAIVVSTLVVKFLHLPTETIGDRFGTLQLAFQPTSINGLSFKEAVSLIQPAIAIALLAGIESLLSAVVADSMTGRRHNSNVELLSQGLANIGSALFGGLPATGAIARTAMNIRSGGHTPVAAFVHAVTVLVFVLYLGSTLSYIPIATLAGILVVISYTMSEWRHFITLFKSPAGDVAILLTTFLLTLFVDLVTGIEVGIILAAFIFMNRMVETSHFDEVREVLEQEGQEEDSEDIKKVEQLDVPEEILIFEVRGALFFAAVEKFKQALKRLGRRPKVLIIRMRRLLDIDASGIRALHDIIQEASNEGTRVVLSGIPETKKLYRTLEKSGIVGRVGKENVQPEIRSAVAHAKTLLLYPERH